MASCPRANFRCVPAGPRRCASPPPQVLAEGDRIKVMVLSQDRERGRVALCTKKLEPTPGDMLRDPGERTPPSQAPIAALCLSWTALHLADLASSENDSPSDRRQQTRGPGAGHTLCLACPHPALLHASHRPCPSPPWPRSPGV